MRLLDYTVSIPSPTTPVRIIPFGCVHAETDGFHEELWRQCVTAIAQPHTYAIGCGDYLDAVRAHARAALQQYRAKDQDKWESQDDWAAKAYGDFYHKYLHAIREKIICLAQGNHYWEFGDGTTSDQYLCRLVGCAYGDKPTFIRLNIRYCNKTLRTFKILVHHGDWSQGYARMGTDVGATERKAEQFDAFDVFIFSHTHRRFSFNMTPSLDLPARGELRLIERPRIVIRTGCFTKSYDQKCLRHYAHRKLLPPTELGHVELTIQFYFKHHPERYQRRRERYPDRHGGQPGNIKYKFSVKY